MAFNKKMHQFLMFPSFRFCPISKIENSEMSEFFFFTSIAGNIWNPRSKKQKIYVRQKSYNFAMWFDKKEYQFLSFLSFWYFPILEIENLDTTESFHFLQIFFFLNALSFRKLKTFIEFQINRPLVY